MNNNTCPICGVGNLTALVDKNKFVDPQTKEAVVVDCEYSTCDCCNSEQASPEQTKRNKQQMLLN